MNFSENNAFLQIFLLILYTFLMLCEISYIKNDKMLFLHYIFVKNRVGGWVVNLDLDNVFKYTLFFFGGYP